MLVLGWSRASAGPRTSAAACRRREAAPTTMGRRRRPQTTARGGRRRHAPGRRPASRPRATTPQSDGGDGERAPGGYGRRRRRRLVDAWRTTPTGARRIQRHKPGVGLILVAPRRWRHRAAASTGRCGRLDGARLHGSGRQPPAGDRRLDAGQRAVQRAHGGDGHPTGGRPERFWLVWITELAPAQRRASPPAVAGGQTRPVTAHQ